MGLLPGAFLAHDLGELAGNDELNRAAEDLTRRFPVLAERILPRFTTSRAQATVAIGTLAAGVTGLSWRAARSAPRSPTMTAYAAATLLLGAHMLPHAMQAIALRRRLPGLAGGLAISLPYSVLVVRRLLHHGPVASDAPGPRRGRGAVLLVPALLGVRALGISAGWWTFGPCQRESFGPSVTASTRRWIKRHATAVTRPNAPPRATPEREQRVRELQAAGIEGPQLATAVNLADQAGERARHLRQHQQQRAAWLDTNADLVAERHAVMQELSWRRRADARVLELDPPADLAAAFGLMPAERKAQAAWRAAVGSI